MGDVLPEDTWSREFQTANPRTLLNSLQRRLQASTTHVHALAELYRERAVIEQEYAAKLSKLARSAESGQLLGKNGTEWERNAGEGKLWDAVLTDIQEVCSHSTACWGRADRRRLLRTRRSLRHSSLISKGPSAISQTRLSLGAASTTRKARLTAP